MFSKLIAKILKLLSICINAGYRVSQTFSTLEKCVNVNLFIYVLVWLILVKKLQNFAQQVKM